MDQLKTAIREKGIAVEELCQYSYDTNRNQTDIKNTKTGEDQTYVYDAENRLSQVSMTKDGKTAVIQQNIYNGEGQRIQKVDGDETTNYYYQNGVVAYTTDANGEQNSQNLIGTDGNVLATERFQQNATQYYLYNKDIQESTSSLVKEDGSADATYQYTDFGETTIHDGVVAYTTDADGNQNSQNLIGTEGNVGAVAGSYKGRLVAKRLGYKGKKRNLFIATYGIKGAVVGAIIGVFAGYGIGVAMGASSSSGLAVKGVNSAIRRVASDQNKVRHIMQSKHEWTKVTKKNQWKYVKPIVKKEMKSGKMEAIGKTKGKEIVYKFVYNYKEKIIEGTCIAKKGVVKLSDAWVKTIGL